MSAECANVAHNRLSGPFRGRDSQRRTDANDGRHKENLEPVLERKLRPVCVMSSTSGLFELDADFSNRKVTEDSILAVQIFDQKKFKKKDQGFLGVINVRIGSVIELDVGGDGARSSCCSLNFAADKR